MKVLNLISMYKTSKVYDNLLNALSKKGIKQLIYVCNKRNKCIDNNNDNLNYKFIYYNKYTIIAGALYYAKIIKAFIYLKNNVNLEEIDLVHAHTLFTDGGIALFLKKKYNIDYIVTVRKTDAFIYLKKMPHAVLLINQIILNAKKVIFISPKTKNNIIKKLNKKGKESLNKKLVVVPNGMDEYWLNNIKRKRKLNNTITFIQASKINKQKRILSTIKLIAYLKQQSMDVKLIIVGDGEKRKKYEKYCKKRGYDTFVKFYGNVDDKEKLMKLYYNSDIFIMPSVTETFGLSYIEAMSQGLPIIYRTGTGIDGYFEKYKVGFDIDRINYKKFAEDVNIILKNYNIISKNCNIECKNFDWEKISKNVLNIYKELGDK